MLKRTRWTVAFLVFIAFLGCGDLRHETQASASPLQSSSSPDGLLGFRAVVLVPDPSLGDTMTTIFFELAEVKQDTVSITVNIKNATNVFGTSHQVYFEPSLEVIKVEAGTFLGEAHQPNGTVDTQIGKTAFLSLVKKEEGMVMIGYTRLGSESGGITGAGTLSRITFKVLEKGRTRLKFGSVDVRDPDIKVIQVREVPTTLLLE